MEAAIPEEFAEPYREALTKLQAEAPPLPAKQVHRVLDQQLGTKWRDRFAEFDDTPTASASIGQVHRAVWADGREVAVRSSTRRRRGPARRPEDAHPVRRAVHVGDAGNGHQTDPRRAECTHRGRELDYRIEADNQRAFAKAFHGDPRFVVPRVVASAPRSSSRSG